MEENICGAECFPTCDNDDDQFAPNIVTTCCGIAWVVDLSNDGPPCRINRPWSTFAAALLSTYRAKFCFDNGSCATCANSTGAELA
jgi:hypothetical protein